VSQKCERCGEVCGSKIVQESGSDIAIITCLCCGAVRATDDPAIIEAERPKLADDIAQEAEIEDDCAGAIASLHEQIDEREEALKLMADHYFTATDWEGPGALCEVCTKAALEDCGPNVKDSEPCEAFHNAENRYEKWAPVRKILGE